MKRLMFTILAGSPRQMLCAPAGSPDGENGGAGGSEADETGEESGEDGDDDDAETDDADGDEDADTDDEDESDDDGKDEDEDADLGGRAQKRIKKLIAQRKEATAKLEAAQKELENVRKLAGDDGKAIMKAAEVSGILPGLMTKDEAEAFADLERYPGVIERLEDWLDEHDSGDEYESGSKTLTYGQVKSRVRRLKAEYQDLRDEYGDRRKALKAKVREIFELGLKAYRDGGGRKPDEKKPAKEKKGAKKLHDRPTDKNRKPKAGASRKSDWGSVRGESDFVRMIADQNKGD